MEHGVLVIVVMLLILKNVLYGIFDQFGHVFVDIEMADDLLSDRIDLFLFLWDEPWWWRLVFDVDVLIMAPVDLDFWQFCWITFLISTIFEIILFNIEVRKVIISILDIGPPELDIIIELNDFNDLLNDSYVHIFRRQSHFRFLLMLSQDQQLLLACLENLDILVIEKEKHLICVSHKLLPLGIDLDDQVQEMFLVKVVVVEAKIVEKTRQNLLLENVFLFYKNFTRILEFLFGRIFATGL